MPRVDLPRGTLSEAGALANLKAAGIPVTPHKIAVTSVHPIGTQTEFFQVAEDNSTRKITEPGGGGHRHSVERVVRGMIRAIEKPKREVWSSPMVVMTAILSRKSFILAPA